jgi:hypothetical protein
MNGYKNVLKRDLSIAKAKRLRLEDKLNNCDILMNDGGDINKFNENQKKISSLMNQIEIVDHEIGATEDALAELN